MQFTFDFPIVFSIFFVAITHHIPHRQHHHLPNCYHHLPQEEIHQVGQADHPCPCHLHLCHPELPGSEVLCGETDNVLEKIVLQIFLKYVFIQRCIKLLQVDVNEKKMFGHSAGNSKSLGAPKFVSRFSLLRIITNKVSMKFLSSGMISLTLPGVSCR